MIGSAWLPHYFTGSLRGSRRRRGEGYLMPVGLKDSHDRTALFHAANRGREEIVDLLMKAGADPQEKNVGGYTDLMLAAIRGDIPAAGAKE